MIEAAALQRIVDLAGAIGGDDDDRRLFGANGAELGDRHLVIRQDFEKEGLEGLVGAVQFVDEEDGGLSPRPAQGVEHGPADQVFFRKDIALHGIPVDAAGSLLHADLDHLGGIVPLIDRRGDVQAFVALQADQPATERTRQHLGDLGLADTRLPLEEKRAAHLEAEIEHRRQRAFCNIVGAGKKLHRLVDGLRKAARGEFSRLWHAASGRCARHWPVHPCSTR